MAPCGPGDNLYTGSVVAVDLKTGKLRWYFQELPHDVWDFDAASPVVLVDLPGAGGDTVRAVAQPGKTGWVYLLDRATGRPIRRSDAFVPQANLFAQPTLEGVRMLPGANGGSEWSPPAYSPATGYLYVLGLHQPMLYKVKPQPLTPPAFWLSGAFYPTGEPQYGLLSAVDLRTGRIAWQDRVADPLIGGALATAGGLVFTGTKDKQFLAFDARTGARLWRYDAQAGVNAPPISYAVNGRQYVAVAAGGNYQINAPRGDEVLAFALDTRRRTPLEEARGEARRRWRSRSCSRSPRRRRSAAQHAPPDTTVRGLPTNEEGQPPRLPPLPAGLTLDAIRAGDSLFHGKGHCFACHGADATGLPDAGSALTMGLNFVPAEWAPIDSVIAGGHSRGGGALGDRHAAERRQVRPHLGRDPRDRRVRVGHQPDPRRAVAGRPRDPCRVGAPGLHDRYAPRVPSRGDSDDDARPHAARPRRRSARLSRQRAGAPGARRRARRRQAAPRGPRLRLLPHDPGRERRHRARRAAAGPLCPPHVHRRRGHQQCRLSGALDRGASGDRAGHRHAESRRHRGPGAEHGGLSLHPALSLRLEPPMVMAHRNLAAGDAVAAAAPAVAGAGLDPWWQAHSALHPAGAQLALIVARLWDPMFATAIVIFALVAGALGWALLRRRGGRPRRRTTRGASAACAGR